MKQLRIVIADDSAMMRSQIRKALSEETGLVAVGEAANGAQAFWLYHQMYPDVLILDLSMPKPSGIEVLQEIRKKDRDTVIIVFTADPALALRDACLSVGANFYLDKSELNSLVNICRQLQFG
jgi:DNA-binding NarL/FixJ family response regulator